MELVIPTTSAEPLAIPIQMGEQLYVVGANGTGKSALFQRWVSADPSAAIKRIPAHRQAWFESGELNFTARSRRQYTENSMRLERRSDARWMDRSPAEKQAAVLFDLVAKDNNRYRTIGQHVDENKLGEATAFASESASLFKQLNELLGLGALAVSLRNSKDEELLAQHRNSDISFSIAKMSDGERAAAMMAATVLTIEPGTVLLIDEPERHLHRSIIEPFLSALFGHRQDCSFIISTHEIALPIANPTANVVMLRSCNWQGDEAIEWDAEVLESGVNLPEALKRDILGARRRILFVEGTPNSLDLPLYGALFPDLSVIPKGSCDEVVRAVKGLRSSYEHHHVEAFGLIDRDDRTGDEVSDLAQDKVFARDVYSVESLYYCSDAIEAVARRQADSLGRDADEMISTTTQRALKVISDARGLPERMAARRSERLVVNRLTAHLPDWKEIMATGEQLTVNKTIENPFQGELDIFNDLNEKGDLDGLVMRYPLRQSDAFDSTAQALECGTKERYERMVVARVRDDERLARKLKERISPLSEFFDAQTVYDS